MWTAALMRRLTPSPLRGDRVLRVTYPRVAVAGATFTRGYTPAPLWGEELGGGMSVVNSSRAAEPVGPYPHARRVGNLLFLSGVGPRTRGAPKGEIPGVTFDAAGNVVSYDI